MIEWLVGRRLHAVATVLGGSEDRVFREIRRYAAPAREHSLAAEDGQYDRAAPQACKDSLQKSSSGDSFRHFGLLGHTCLSLRA